MFKYLELAKELERKTDGEFYVEDNLISSSYLESFLEINPDEEVDKQKFKKELFESLVNSHEYNMETYSIQASDDAYYLIEDCKIFYKELKMIEEF